MKIISKLFLIGLFAASLALSASATQTIGLPYSTLPSGAPGTTGYTTNLANGWTNSYYTTNVVRYYTNSTASFVTVTNYTTNNVITFADIDLSQMLDFSIIAGNGVSGVTTVGAITNRTLTFARLVDGIPDNVNAWAWSFPCFGTTNWFTATNFPESWVGSFNKVRIIQDQYWGTNSLTLTNAGVKVPDKRVTPSPSGR